VEEKEVFWCPGGIEEGKSGRIRRILQYSTENLGVDREGGKAGG
jgi:hypothetical protein